MIEVIQQQFNDHMNVEQKMHVTREYLQILCLKIMNDKKMFNQFAFIGRTALRILYDLRRFSEDLDFSTITKPVLSIEEINNLLVKTFELYGLKVETKVKSIGAVRSIMLKFRGLLKELDISPLESQTLSIKWEVDTNPPAGAQVEDTIVNKSFIFTICHYNLASLFAGKLHACFFRKYIKGRDFYDFIWYLGKKVKPNFLLLNNAVVQSQGIHIDINEHNFKDFLLEKIEYIDFEKVKNDVERFIEDKNELHVFEKHYFRDTIRNLIYLQK